MQTSSTPLPCKRFPMRVGTMLIASTNRRTENGHAPVHQTTLLPSTRPDTSQLMMLSSHSPDHVAANSEYRTPFASRSTRLVLSNGHAHTASSFPYRDDESLMSYGRESCPSREELLVRGRQRFEEIRRSRQARRTPIDGTQSPYPG